MSETNISFRNGAAVIILDNKKNVIIEDELTFTRR